MASSLEAHVAVAHGELCRRHPLRPGVRRHRRHRRCLLQRLRHLAVALDARGVQRQRLALSGGSRRSPTSGAMPGRSASRTTPSPSWSRRSSFWWSTTSLSSWSSASPGAPCRTGWRRRSARWACHTSRWCRLGALLAFAYQESRWDILYFPFLVFVIYNGFKLYANLQTETDHALVLLPTPSTSATSTPTPTRNASPATPARSPAPWPCRATRSS